MRSFIRPLQISLIALLTACSNGSDSSPQTTPPTPQPAPGTSLALTDFIHSLTSTQQTPGTGSMVINNGILELRAQATINPIAPFGITSSIATYGPMLTLEPGDYELEIRYAFSMLANVMPSAGITLNGTQLQLVPNSFAFDDQDIIADLGWTTFGFTFGSNDVFEFDLRANAGDDSGMALPSKLFVAEVRIVEL